MYEMGEAPIQLDDRFIFFNIYFLIIDLLHISDLILKLYVFMLF